MSPHLWITGEHTPRPPTTPNPHETKKTHRTIIETDDTAPEDDTFNYSTEEKLLHDLDIVYCTEDVNLGLSRRQIGKSKISLSSRQPGQTIR